MKAVKAKAKPAGNDAQQKTASGDVIELLKADHRRVEQIFEQYEQDADREMKGQLAHQVCLELIVHTRLEEELFYPACREKGVDHDMLDEAQVEHDGAKVLIGDLLKGTPGDDYYDAKVKTLSEYIKHHVAEEEKPRSGIFAKAKASGMDMGELGSRLQARKTELMAQSEAMTSRPPQPRSFQLQPQEIHSMARYDRDRDERGRFMDEDRERGMRSRYGNGTRERDEQGRFVSDDERGSSRYRSDYDEDRGPSRDRRGWYGDPEGHSRAAREGWDEREGNRYRDYDDDERGSRYRARGEGRGYGHGGWFGDPEGHSQASREGWHHSSHEGSGWRGDPEGHSRASREGWRHSSHEGSGWYGDPEGHSEASREGWEERGRYSGRQSGRGRDDDEDDRRSRNHRGGWYGDPEAHARASREGWRDR